MIIVAILNKKILFHIIKIILKIQVKAKFDKIIKKKKFFWVKKQKEANGEKVTVSVEAPKAEETAVAEEPAKAEKEAETTAE